MTDSKQLKILIVNSLVRPANADQAAQAQANVRAKGLLMERHHCSEDEAYRKLRRLAMDKNSSCPKWRNA
jgi:AmiR/NasT family two-component response regulator